MNTHKNILWLYHVVMCIHCISKQFSLSMVFIKRLIDWLIDWLILIDCYLIPTLAIFPLYCGVNNFYKFYKLISSTTRSLEFITRQLPGKVYPKTLNPKHIMNKYQRLSRACIVHLVIKKNNWSYVKTMSCSGSHLGITINIKNTKFVKDLPMIDAQFRFNQCNSFREEYISVFFPYGPLLILWPVVAAILDFRSA